MWSHFALYSTETLGLLITYFGILAMLSFYGSHRYLIVYLYKKFAQDRPDPAPMRSFPDEALPCVTIQLPMFNERYVAARHIDAVAAIDYPHDRLDIQVLDDSTDDTTDICRERIAAWQARGVPIRLLHRTDRAGFKAGALAEGLKVARGELVAIFDADFLPTPSFLHDTIHHFSDPKIGMVQTRWEHINRDYSLLTRAQAILLDGHFVLEHTARNRSGRFFNFNGTAGVWRASTIAQAGGWQHDTLTEDLDLSYRAQLLGWQFRFLRDVTAPSEIPVEMNALKSQQHRWAKGSIQTAKKLLLPVLRADLPLRVKIEAFQHMTANIAYLLMVLLAVIMPLATILRVQQGLYETLLLDLPIFFCATLSICYFYWVSQREIGRSRFETLRMIPVVLAIGIGLSVNNAKAVIEALVGHESPFVRTPKYGIERADQSWRRKLYSKRSTLITLIELSLGAWFTYAIIHVLTSPKGSLFSLPFLMLFQIGFLYVAASSVLQGLTRQRQALHTP